MNVNDSKTFVYPNLISDLEYQKYLREDVAVTVFLSILSIVGTIGNIHAFLVYLLRYRPSNHRTFVVSLAAIDCVASAISIPFEIFDIRYSYSFTSSAACKSFRTITHGVVVASGVLLGVIAVERFRKACKPLDPQLGPRGAVCACVITVVCSFLFSIPAFFLYDATEEIIEGNFFMNNTYYLFENITLHDNDSFIDFVNSSSSYDIMVFPSFENITLYGYDCQVATKYRKSLFNTGYNGFYLLLSTSVFILCIVMYSFVGKALYKQVKFRQRAQSFKRRPSNSSLSSTVLTKLDKSTYHDITEEESSSTGERRKSIVRKNSSVSLHSSQPKKHRRMDRTRKITLMFLVATAVSYIGFVPNLVILLIKALSKKRYDKLSSTLGMGTEVLLRMYFLNNVTNPLVYCFLDDKFRNECKMLYKKLVFWKK